MGNNKIEALSLHLASPEEIRSWSHGEVAEAETLDYRIGKPKPHGLFCEIIFGPTRSYRCRCGKLEGKSFEGQVCDKCHGRDLSIGLDAQIGEAVGAIAEQSIVDPGTQLTLHICHTGGIAADITVGLPRVQSIFEGRTPKGQAAVSTLDGIVQRSREGPRLTVPKGIQSWPRRH